MKKKETRRSVGRREPSRAGGESRQRNVPSLSVPTEVENVNGQQLATLCNSPCKIFADAGAQPSPIGADTARPAHDDVLEDKRCSQLPLAPTQWSRRADELVPRRQHDCVTVVRRDRRGDTVP